VRALALAVPGVEEGTSYGTPAFKVSGKLLARLHQDGESLVVYVEPDARDLLLRADPEAFYLTDHYAAHPWVLVRLARVQRGPLAVLIEEAWRSRAPQRSLARTPAPEEKPPRPRQAKREQASPPLDALERLRAVCLALPEVTESVAHGRPCFAVRGKNFVMFLDDHHGDGRLALWCKAPPGAQATLVEASPERFFVPPYLGPRGWIGARLEASRVDWSVIEACVGESYRMTAPALRARKPLETRKGARDRRGPAVT